MASTGLLVLEVNVRCGEGTNLMSMAETVLGKWAKYLVAFLFAFLFYCLILAYIAGTGSILEESFDLNRTLGSVLTVVLFGYAIYKGTREVDFFNRIFFIGLILGYALLVFLGISAISKENLAKMNWSYAAPVLPAMIISFGYHNLIPSLNTYLKGDLPGLRRAILIGSFIPLIVYLVWELVFLGSVPNTAQNLEAIRSGAMVTELFRNGTGSLNAISAMQFFSFFAIVTSLLTVAMSFVDFVIDGLKMEQKRSSRALSCAIVLIPPLLFSLLYPNIFLSALNYAGAFSAVIIFGVLPVIMAWKGRYIDRVQTPKQLPGGKILLASLAVFALFIFFMQLKIELWRLE